jgi:hypothetical protein
MLLRCESLEPPMSFVGQILLLPHCNTDDRFTPINRHYLTVTGGSIRIQARSIMQPRSAHARHDSPLFLTARVLLSFRARIIREGRK